MRENDQGKIRVYELAKNLGIQSKELIKLLEKEGYKVTSSLSTIPGKIANQLVKKSKVKEGKKEKKKKKEKGKNIHKKEEIKDNTITIGRAISVSELEELMNVPANEIIGSCLKLGMQVTINQRLDFDTASLIAEEFGYTTKLAEDFNVPEIEEERYEIKKKTPVVTVMGHVDHGKTTLLDYVRKTRVAAQELGGITQKIGAYNIEYNGHKITFIDTPGHEAFTAMRARGANVTDIVVLVVAANEGVKPQTVEAIDHARAAGVPIVVAINKMDLASANPDKVLSKLSKNGVVVQEYGGNVLAVKTSALKGEGIDELLDAIILQAEDLGLKAPTKGLGIGTILETKIRKGLGNIATVVVKEGEVKTGDSFVAGSTCGKVRLILDENDKKLEKVSVSSAIQISQFEDLPEAGDTFRVVRDQRTARSLSEIMKMRERERELSQQQSVSLSSLYEKIEEGKKEILKVVIKGDDAGSVEALSDSLKDLSTDLIKIQVIHAGVGPITENDVMLASASKAIVIGFKVHPYSRAKKEAKKRGVEIKTYGVIFEIIEDVKLAMVGLLKPEKEEVKCGEVEIRQIFEGSTIGKVAGCYVRSGEVHNKDIAVLIRDGKELGKTKIETLKRFDNDVKVVEEGYECGIKLEVIEDFKAGDIIETYKVVEKERTI